MNLTNERAVGLEQQEELEVNLVEPLTKLQLLEDIKDRNDFRFIRSRRHKNRRRHIAKEYKHMLTD